jgi:hypothetical protein
MHLLIYPTDIYWLPTRACARSCVLYICRVGLATWIAFSETIGSIIAETLRSLSLVYKEMVKYDMKNK